VVSGLENDRLGREVWRQAGIHHEGESLTVSAGRVVSLATGVNGEVEWPAEKLSDEEVEADDDRRVLKGLSELILSDLGNAAVSVRPMW